MRRTRSLVSPYPQVFALNLANVGTMLCQKYDADTPTVLRGTFWTTLLSLVTIPVLVLVMG